MLLHEKDGVSYVEASTSGNYSIRVRNPSRERLLAVISVDGINILDGEPAKSKGKGYVVSPYQTFDIKGWHRTSEETAAFAFKEVEDSYASKMGHGESNVGVIGVAIFREKRVVAPPPRYFLHSSDKDYLDYDYNFICESSFAGALGEPICASAPAANSAGKYMAKTTSRRVEKKVADIKKVGTGYGERLKMRTRETTFETNTQEPENVFVLRCATRPTLVKWGVVSENKPVTPNPFPADKVGVPAPDDWIG